MLCPQCDDAQFPSGKDSVTPHVSSDDLRPHNIARLRFAINQFDWGE